MHANGFSRIPSLRPRRYSDAMCDAHAMAPPVPVSFARVTRGSVAEQQKFA